MERRRGPKKKTWKGGRSNGSSTQSLSTFSSRNQRFVSNSSHLVPVTAIMVKSRAILS